ncbi:MAG: hypothetical protein QOH49_2478 [Acidobacteriota bacterium]|jgi:hypothetical protein|nr:hypothetical protein [Acidobacteriota bacterium]
MRETRGGEITFGNIATANQSPLFENNTGSLIYQGVTYKYFSTSFFTTDTTWFGSLYVYNTEFPTAEGNKKS